ncbi:hypothetical protein AU490_05675 [Lonsdalea populi]|nr:hypothetical protein AU486_00915 [Lonsdalea quercina]RAT29648.1 hypothetical protein AU490_05675 [Lonsdalea populi]RAT39136.1 hypothetical protein AU491_02345 [Lonsdalea populi]RAT51132.1 hypothetical protein AU498_11395 [Lonsdalea populi]RAT52020.1 hypothetical protein AU497_09465 [Lonsdalea populi]
MSLADARQQRDGIRKLLAQNTNPAQQRAAEKAARSPVKNFKTMALGWHKSNTGAERKKDCRGLSAAFAEGKLDDIVSLLDDNIVWHIDGEPGVSSVGLLKGPAGLQDFPQNFKPRDFSISEIIPHNDSVLVLGRFRHIVLSAGNAVGSDIIIHFKVSGSKIIRYQMLEGPALLAGLLMPVMNGSFSRLELMALCIITAILAKDRRLFLLTDCSRIINFSRHNFRCC